MEKGREKGGGAEIPGLLRLLVEPAFQIRQFGQGGLGAEPRELEGRAHASFQIRLEGFDLKAVVHSCAVHSLVVREAGRIDDHVAGREVETPAIGAVRRAGARKVEDYLHRRVRMHGAAVPGLQPVLKSYDETRRRLHYPPDRLRESIAVFRNIQWRYSNL
jgi:hypothetical protein